MARVAEAADVVVGIGTAQGEGCDVVRHGGRGDDAFLGAVTA